MRIHPRLRRALGTGSRFLLVGGLSTIIEIVSFNILVFALGMDPVWAKVTASLIALINAYFGNRHWAFRGRQRRQRAVEIALFLATNAVCTALGALIVWGGDLAAAEILGFEPGAVTLNVINLASIAIIVVVRFALYHWGVFRVPASARAKADAPAAEFRDAPTV